MEEFKATGGTWIYVPELGEVRSLDAGVVAEVAVDGNEDSNGYLMAASKDLFNALRNLEVAVNTIKYCWEKRPENMWAAMQRASSDAEVARSAIAKALGK